MPGSPAGGASIGRCSSSGTSTYANVKDEHPAPYRQYVQPSACTPFLAFMSNGHHYLEAPVQVYICHADVQVLCSPLVGPTLSCEHVQVKMHREVADPNELQATLDDLCSLSQAAWNHAQPSGGLPGQTQSSPAHSMGAPAEPIIQVGHILTIMVLIIPARRACVMQ